MFPQFPYIAHSRGWSAEDMERNIAYVRGSVRAGRKASMPVRDLAPGEKPDVYVEGEPMMKAMRGEELTEG